MKFSLPLFILLCLSSFNNLKAQYFSAEIIDNNQQPIIFAHVFNKSNNNHVHSDEEGRFKLKANLGDSIVVSHLIFETQSFILNDMGLQNIITLEESSINLDEVVIRPSINALRILSQIDTEINPVNSSQEILRQVPGLFIGQHAGGGKAEQIFLRGFDIDHGTDVTITVDDIPVNKVSHAHGQGYADLHFVIPETIKNMDFGKGPYYANQGNFNTAGYVNFSTKNFLDHNSIKLEAGQFNTQRIVTLFKLFNTSHSNSYLATEFLNSNGPFESPQDFNRLNGLFKFNTKLSKDHSLGLTISHFASEWDASGQIPERAVNDNSITRFGAIDDTEGGSTSRTNILLNHRKKLGTNTFFKNSIFYSKYDFDLFSNFTFFLNNPINGDQIRQTEKRDLYGIKSEIDHYFNWNETELKFKTGLSLRNDIIKDNQLSQTLNRTEILRRLSYGDVTERNLGLFSNLEITKGSWLFNPSIRFDGFRFSYLNRLSNQEGKFNKSVVTAKMNVLYNFSDKLQLYFKSGQGFHSNDARIILNNEVDNALPLAWGNDLGIIWKPSSKAFLNVAVWNLNLEQEFVYVGDAGIVEPSGKTTRKGVDLSFRSEVMRNLFYNMDFTYAYSRADEEESGENFIPLAPKVTFTSGINYNINNFISGFRLRYLSDRPANEDNSIVAKGYTVFDLNMSYTYKHCTLSLAIQNIFDTEWNETQFATESRLFEESESVEEIHFTPGTPRFLKAGIEVKF